MATITTTTTGTEDDDRDDDDDDVDNNEDDGDIASSPRVGLGYAHIVGHLGKNTSICARSMG